MNVLLTHLRPATIDDCTAIYEVHRLAIRDLCNRLPESETARENIRLTWLSSLSPENYALELHQAHKKSWVIEYRGEIRGFFQLDTNMAQLDALYVHPFMQRQGLGTALLNCVESLVIESDLSMLRLYSLPYATPFYLLNHYQILGHAVLPLSQTVKVDCQLLRKYL